MKSPKKKKDKEPDSPDLVPKKKSKGDTFSKSSKTYKQYFSNVFPGDDDPKTFDTIERIQKLVIIDTTKEVINNWGVSHFLKPTPAPISRNSFESFTTIKEPFISRYMI